MSWTRPDELYEQVLKLWDRGTVLESIATEEPLFPFRLKFKSPSPGEITNRFEEVRRWIAEIRSVSAVRIVSKTSAHRVLGLNDVPSEAWVDSLEDALAITRKKQKADVFRVLMAKTRAAVPELVDWLKRRPLRAVELASEWDALLGVVAWIRQHPRPGIYLRQIDLPGIDTKFIEAHRGVLAEFLDLVLPPEAIDTRCSGVARFSARYGFREKPQRVRFRVLDPSIPVMAGTTCPDATLDAQSFATLSIPVRVVFITENETNFLAFPCLPGALVLFGAGYGWDSLAPADWLGRCRIFYWGDIDTHGFAILDQLRGIFPHVESLLMDRATLLAHRDQWGHESPQSTSDARRLTEEERDLFVDLRSSRFGEGVRLEQERIGFAEVRAELERVTALTNFSFHSGHEGDHKSLTVPGV